MWDISSRAGGKVAAASKIERHHPALIALHWISALLILAALASGIFLLRETPNSSSEKIVELRAHMILGLTILLLTIVQFAMRVFAQRPPRATTGIALLDKIAAVTHYGLYLAVVVMALSGLATAQLAGLAETVFGGSSAPLPESLSEYPTRIAHAVLANIIIALVVLHLLGTLYHHLFRRDGLLRRMWFGRR